MRVGEATAAPAAVASCTNRYRVVRTGRRANVTLPRSSVCVVSSRTHVGEPAALPSSRTGSWTSRRPPADTAPCMVAMAPATVVEGALNDTVVSPDGDPPDGALPGGDDDVAVGVTVMRSVAGPGPLRFTARTAKAYCCPTARLLTVALVAVPATEVTTCWAASTTSYALIWAEPSSMGGSHDSTAEPASPTAVGSRGTEGTVSRSTAASTPGRSLSAVTSSRVADGRRSTSSQNSGTARLAPQSVNWTTHWPGCRPWIV